MSNDVIERYKQYLTNAQIKELAAKAERYKLLNAQRRAQTQNSIITQQRQARRALQNVGLASREGKVISGMETARNDALAKAYDTYNQQLRKVEEARAETEAVRMANATIRARQKAQEDALLAQQQAQAEAMAAQRERNALRNQVRDRNQWNQQMTDTGDAPRKQPTQYEQAMSYALQNGASKKDAVAFATEYDQQQKAYEQAKLNASTVKNWQQTMTGKERYQEQTTLPPKVAQMEIQDAQAKWEASAKKAAGIEKPKNRNEYERKKEADAAAAEYAAVLTKWERVQAAAKYPQFSKYLLMTDEEFSVAYAAAKAINDRDEKTASARARSINANVKYDPAKPQYVTADEMKEESARRLAFFDEAKRLRDETEAAPSLSSTVDVPSQDRTRYYYPGTTKPLDPAAFIRWNQDNWNAVSWAKASVWDGQNWKNAIENDWSAEDYDKKHGTQDSKYAALINEWSFINGRTALLYTQKFNNVQNLADFKELFSGDDTRNDAYRTFRFRCMMAFNDDDYESTRSKEKLEQMDAMLTLANLMTDEERARFNGMLETYGAKYADEYFDYLYNDVLPQRFLQYTQNELAFDTRTADRRIGQSLMSVPTNIAQGWSGVIHTIGTKQTDPVAAQLGATKYNMAQTMRGAVGEHYGEVGNFLYQTGMSMADSATVALISGGIGKAVAGLGVPAKLAGKVGSTLGGSLLGASAYNSAYADALQKGLSPEKARLTALGNGVNEMLFEALSLDLLVDRFKTGDIVKVSEKAWKNWVVNTLLQAGVEGSEEAFTDIANNWWDKKVNGIYSEELKKLREYIADGMSYEDAKRKVAAEFNEQLGMSFLGGAISGGVMGGAAGARYNFTMRGFEKQGKSLDSGLRSKIDGFQFKDKQMQELQQQSKKTNQDYGVLLQGYLAEKYGQFEGTVQQAVKDGTITNEDAALLEKWQKGEVTAEQMQTVNETLSKLDIKPLQEIAQAQESIRFNQQVGVKNAEMLNAFDARNEAAEKTYNETVNAINADTTLTAEQKKQRIAEAKQTRADARSAAARDFDKAWNKSKGKLTIEGNTVKVGRGSGTVTFDFSMEGHNTLDTMTEREKSALRIAQVVASRGVNVKVESEFGVDENGVDHRKENGYYDRETQTIHVNLSGDNAVLYTVSHELTHHLANVNEQAYNDLRNAIRDELQKSDLTASELERGGFAYDLNNVVKFIEKTGNLWDALVQYEAAPKEEGGRGYGETAEEEVVARCCESFLANNVFIQSFAKKNFKSAKAIASFLTQMSADMTQLFTDADIRAAKSNLWINESPEQQILSQVANVQEIAQKWSRAVNSLDSKRKANTVGTRASQMENQPLHIKIEADNDILSQNIKDGKAAIDKVVKTHENVENAMFRTDIGSIDFVWGKEGKRGYGIAHIIEKRNAEDGSGVETANKMVEVIAKAEKAVVQRSNDPNAQRRIKLFYDGYTAVLTKTSESENNWLLTGWKDKNTETSAYGEGYDSSVATTKSTTHTRADGDVSDINSISSTKDVVKQEITSAKTSIKQIPALFTNSNVKFGKTNIDIGGGRFDLATDYLAKPRRAVGLDEIKAVIMPQGEYADLKTKLDERGIPVVEYEKDNSEDRLRALNSDVVSKLRFSMMDKEFRKQPTQPGAVERRYQQGETTASVYGTSVEMEGGTLLNRVRMMQNLAEMYGSVTVHATDAKEAQAFEKAGAQRVADPFVGENENDPGTWEFAHQENKYETDTKYDAKQKRNFANAVLKEVGTYRNFKREDLRIMRARLEKAFAVLHNAWHGDGDQLVAMEYADKLFDQILNRYTEMSEADAEMRDAILAEMPVKRDARGREYREIEVTAAQMAEIKNKYTVAEYNAALSKALGTRVVVKQTENAQTLEDVFADNPYLEADTNEGDMPTVLLDRAQETVGKRTNPYKAESAERTALKDAMMSRALTIVGVEKSAAQKVREAVKQVRAEERAKAKDRTASAVAKVREEERAKARKREAKLKDVTQRKLAQQKVELLRRDVKTIALKWNQRLVKMLANPTEASHIPVQLAREVAELTDALTRFLDSGTERGQINLAKIAKAYQQAFDDQATIAQAKAENPNYDPRGQVLDKEMFDEQLVQMMNELNEVLQGKTLKDLDVFEMRMLLNTVRGVAHTVYDANRSVVKGEKRLTYKIAEKMKNELVKAKNVFGKKTNAITRFLNQYTIESLGLRRIAKIYSGSNENAEFVKLVDDLNQGALEVERIALALRKMFDPVTTKYAKEMKTWYGKNAEWIDIGNGVKITKGMRVSLAMHILNEQNMRNLSDRGVTIPEQTAYMRGDYEQAYTDGTIVRMTKEQAEKIVSQMTEAEKAYFEVAKEFFHNRAGYYINRTSLKLLGYAKATVENYFPIQVDDAYKKVEYDSKSISKNASVEHPGFLEARKGTTSVMYLNDITAVVNRQINGVSKYAGLAIPMRNWNAVMNQLLYHEDAEGNWVADEGDVHRALQKQMGYAQIGKTESGGRVSMVSFVDQFIEDLAGASINNANDNVSAATIGKWVTSNYVKAVLTLNARVALSQLASVPTAAAEIPWKYLAQSFAGNVEGHLNRNASNELIDQYTPIFAMRRAGTQTEVSEVMKRRGLVETAEQKLPGLLGWITAMDTAATRRLWYACERWVKGETNIPVGSDAFYKEVAKRYERVIQNTQPNFTVLQRSPVLRSKNAFARIISLFGTQPMQNVGVFMESAFEVAQTQRGTQQHKAALKRFGRSLSGLLTAAFVIAVERALVNAVRGRVKQMQDDEEDKITFESVAKYMGGEFMSSLVGSFMYVGQLYDVIHGVVGGLTDGDYGYDSSFSLPASEALATILNFVQKKGWQYFANMRALDAKGNPKYSDHEKWLKTKTFVNELATVASYLTGLPLANASKTILNGWHPLGHDIADMFKTGEFIPYLHQSGRIDKKKTYANYTEWTNLGFKGSEYLYWEKKLSEYGKRDERIPILMASDLTDEQKAMMLRMMDTAEATSEGTKVYKKNGDLLIDFANPTEKQQALPMPEPKPSISEEPTAAPAAEPTATPNPLCDAKQEGVQQSVAQGVPEQTATDAFLTYQNIGAKEGRDDEFREWLFKNVDDPHQRAVLEYQVIGRASRIEGAVTYRDSGVVYRDYTNESWYKLSQHSLAKDGTNKRYDAAKKLEKTGLSVDKTVAIYDGLKDLTKKAEWTEFLKAQGLSDEQVNIFLWSRGWAK